MVPGSPNGTYLGMDSPVVWEDGQRVCRRGWELGSDGRRLPVFLVTADEPASRSGLERLAHEFALKDLLDGDWAARPLAFLKKEGRTLLVLEDAGGAPLDRLTGTPMEIGHFLRLAIAISAALGKLHRRGLVHKDIKPANILVDDTIGAVCLTGFGMASRLARQRHSPDPPETIAGTLAYMAPEQTGRMSRSIDSRSDLYALGVTLYQMLTGALPFSATNPMEWVHCHLAKRPVPPSRRRSDVPYILSAIIMKLLAKQAEDRYQTAAGLERDLHRCQGDWDDRHRIDSFTLGGQDFSDRLVIPEKLYGREREAETLRSSFDRIAAGGGPALVLISGHSGVGKSSLVNELQPLLVPHRGLFASGKFDQYRRDIPYATLAQVLQGLIRPLLGKSEAELAPWRSALEEALGFNLGLIVSLVPDLAYVVGEQPPVPAASPQDAQRRFQVALSRFIGVFAQPDHPVVLFLDDLQWLDAETLNFLNHLLGRADLRHLLIIGAYRDNEVTPAHPLHGELRDMRLGRAVQEITLKPLTASDVAQIVSDAIQVDIDASAELAALVHEKTGGNPLFAAQFLYALGDEGLLSFDSARMRWEWDIEKIRSQRHTENVVDLLVGKLTRLAPDTQAALQQLACLGNAAEVAILAAALAMPEAEVHAALLEPLRQQLVEFVEHAYRFAHDRVQEAAYALVPNRARAAMHLQTGLRLTAGLPPEKRRELVFEIATQMNRGATLITSPRERLQLAELNLAAGKRAKETSAFGSALTYLAAGAALSRSAGSECPHDLAFELDLHLADCEVCTGALAEAEERLGALMARSVGTIQQCAVARRRVDLHTMLGDGERAVAVALRGLRQGGIDWSAHPSRTEARAEYERFWTLLGDRTIEDILDLPLMRDPGTLATLDLLTKLSLPAEYIDENLVALSICRVANLSLERGNNEAAPVSYAAMGMIASTRFGEHERGYRLAKMACDLVERHGFASFGGRAFNRFAVVIPWTRPISEAIAPSRRAFDMAKYQGEPTFAALSCRSLISALLASGQHLDDIEGVAEQGLEFVRPFGLFLDRMSAPLALVRTLRGKTATFGRLDDDTLTEAAFESGATGEPAHAFLECYYWLRKLQARFFAGHHEAAIAAANKVSNWYASSASLSLLMLEKTEYHFYAALSLAAQHGPGSDKGREGDREAIAGHERELRIYAESCPQNFGGRAALVGAEIARVEGRALEAMDLYERAIASARANGFVHDEAIAFELAARFHGDRGFADIARLYLGHARSAYLRWGADGKVRQLDRLHPQLRQDRSAADPAATMETPVEQLDLTTVIAVSQALSGEMVLDTLVQRLMRTALEHAGAERGLLIIPDGEDLRIDAEAVIRSDQIEVSVSDRQHGIPAAFPDAIVRYVLRTHDPVILDIGLSERDRFREDSYIAERRRGSLLCLPLLHKNRIVGALLLENSLAPGIFTPDRVVVLKVLASQAAISLENTRLYQEVSVREAKIKRLFDADLLGTFVWNHEGTVVEANDAFLRMVQYDREDIVSRRLNWSRLTPPEWRELDDAAVEQIRQRGTATPYEKEYFRKDGTRIPILTGRALLETNGTAGVGFVLDLSALKRAEQMARESEAKFRDYAETASDWFWEIGPDYRFTLLTENAFGSDPSSRIGTACWDHALDLETEPEKWRLMQQTLDRREPFRDFVYCGSGNDGQPLYVRSSGKPIFGADGGFLGYRGTGADVTTIIRAQKAVRESERSLRQTIDGIPGLVAILTAGGEVDAINRQIAEYCGQPLEELRHWGTNGIVHPRDMPQLADVFVKAIAQGTPYEVEARLRRFDGSYRWFDVRGIPVRDSAGQVSRWYVLLTDVEDRTRALARLQQMQSDFAHVNRVSVMGELAASLSHEITQPIASARNNARAALNFLGRTPPDVEEVREALACVVGDTDRAGSIIDRIRDQMRKAPPRKDHFALDAAIVEVVALARTAIIENGVSVQTRFDEHLPPVYGDRIQLQQVVLNLAMNAVEAMSTGGPQMRALSICTERQGDDVVVTVRDTGPGFQGRDPEHLFEAFYTTKARGTGMGLPICRSIIVAHGGRLWASANEDRGATFHFTLPVRG